MLIDSLVSKLIKLPLKREFVLLLLRTFFTKDKDDPPS